MPITDKQAGLINAGAQLFGQGLNAMAQGSMNRKTRKWNEKMYAQQRADSLADWNMQNEYNSPQAQMRRLQQAGLNPNLVYDNGATTQASAVRSSNVESWKPNAPQFDLGQVAQTGLFSYLDAEFKKTQIDNLKAINTVSVQEALLKAAQTAGTIASTAKTEQDTATGKFNLELAKQLQGTTLEQAQAELKKTMASTQVMLSAEERQKMLTSSSLREAAERILSSRVNRASTTQQMEQTRQQIKNLQKDETLKQLDIDLRKMGIQPGDNLFLRILGRVLNNSPLGDGLNDIIDKNFNGGDYYFDEKGNRIPTPKWAK